MRNETWQFIRIVVVETLRGLTGTLRSLLLAPRYRTDNNVELDLVRSSTPSSTRTRRDT